NRLSRPNLPLGRYLAGVLRRSETTAHVYPPSHCGGNLENASSPGPQRIISAGVEPPARPIPSVAASRRVPTGFGLQAANYVLLTGQNGLLTNRRNVSSQ